MAAERVQYLKPATWALPLKCPGRWSCIHEIYESVINRIRTELPHADDSITTWAVIPLESHQNGTNMYFVDDYNVVD